MTPDHGCSLKQVSASDTTGSNTIGCEIQSALHILEQTVKVLFLCGGFCLQSHISFLCFFV